MLLLRDPGRELLKPGQLSPRLDVPANIQRPPYVDTGENPWIEDIQVHTKDVCVFFWSMSLLTTCNIASDMPSHTCHMQELKKMRAACKLGADVREFAGTLVKVRISAFEGLTDISLICASVMYAALSAAWSIFDVHHG